MKKLTEKEIRYLAFDLVNAENETDMENTFNAINHLSDDDRAAVFAYCGKLNKMN